MADNLSHCLVRQNKLAEEKSKWKDERRQLMANWGMQLRDIRARHETETSYLAAELRQSAEKVVELEKKLEVERLDNSSG